MYHSNENQTQSFGPPAAVHAAPLANIVQVVPLVQIFTGGIFIYTMTRGSDSRAFGLAHTVGDHQEPVPGDDEPGGWLHGAGLHVPQHLSRAGLPRVRRHRSGPRA